MTGAANLGATRASFTVGLFTAGARFAICRTSSSVTVFLALTADREGLTAVAGDDPPIEIPGRLSPLLAPIILSRLAGLEGRNGFVGA